jgi:hypothetical protein
MAPFESREEFLQAVRELMTRLRASGHEDAIAQLKQGFKYMNGMADGWALLMSSIDTVQANFGPRFTPEEREALVAIRAEVYTNVTRGKS